MDPFNSANIEAAFGALTQKRNCKAQRSRGRRAPRGVRRSAGPGLWELSESVGKNEVIKRIAAAEPFYAGMILTDETLLYT